ncbi:MAG: efflux RND transporter periplasmic adaptor subunit [Pirellulales bacterium]
MHAPQVSAAVRAAQRVSLLAVVALSGGLFGCTRGPNQYVEPPPPEVTVVTPKQETVTDYVEVTGVAQPVMSVDIRARVKGFLVERHFEEGSFVKQGQLLLVIDEEPFRVKLEQAKARLAEAEASLAKAQQSQSREVARAQLALDESQLRLAQDDERRVRGLVQSHALTEQDLEQSTAALQKNIAQVNATKASLQQTDADYETNIRTAQALVAGARTAVRDAEIELSYCRILAPIDGRISRVYFDVGNLVGDGQSSLLANVVKTAPIYAYASLSLENFLKYRQAAGGSSEGAAVATQVPVELGLSNEPGYPHRGAVDYHDPQVDPGTSTIQIRGVFPNEDSAILPGMFVRVRIPYQQRANALLVPERALSIDQVGNFLLVVGQEDKVEYRPVQVGAAIDGYRVVSGQIAANDRVITEGLLRARPGMKVTPKTETSAVAIYGAAAPAAVASNKPAAAATGKN